jgi:hypothetical protein
MTCPRCKHRMSIGSAHDPTYAYQYECHTCGKIIPIHRYTYRHIYKCLAKQRGFFLAKERSV